MELEKRSHDKLAHSIKHDYNLSRVNESVNCNQEHSVGQSGGATRVRA